MGKQGHGRRLTDKERMEIIALTRQQPRIKHVELAARYCVNESTIRKWRRSANAEKIETRYGAGIEEVRDARQRGQSVRNADFDVALFEWVAAQRTQSVELPPFKIRERARELAAQYDDMKDFKASSGWYYRFCRRYGLPCTAPKVKSDPPAASATEVSALPLPVTPSAPPAAAKAVSAAAATLATTAVEQTNGNPAIGESTTLVVALAGGDDAAEDTSVEPEEAQDEQTNAVESIETAPQAPTPPAPTAAPTSEPPCESTATPPRKSKKRKFADATAQESAVGAAADVVDERSAESPPRSSPPVDAALPQAAQLLMSPPPPVAASPLQVPMASPVMSVRQEAISHFLRHHKHLLSLASRLRFIKHLAHANEEAEMYTVMDDETRVEYIKEFADTSGSGNSGSAPAGVIESLVV